MLTAAINFFIVRQLHFIAHCKAQDLSALSCVKIAELIKMQFGMLSQVGPGNMYYTGM